MENTEITILVLIGFNTEVRVWLKSIIQTVHAFNVLVALICSSQLYSQWSYPFWKHKNYISLSNGAKLLYSQLPYYVFLFSGVRWGNKYILCNHKLNSSWIMYVFSWDNLSSVHFFFPKAHTVLFINSSREIESPVSISRADYFWNSTQLWLQNPQQS